MQSNLGPRVQHVVACDGGATWTRDGVTEFVPDKEWAEFPERLARNNKDGEDEPAAE